MAPVLTFVASKDQEAGLHTLYLGAVAFGVTLLVASFLLGGKDTDHGGGGHDADMALAWAPIGSLRFWVFLFTFGGGAGFALTKLGSSSVIAGVGAASIGWISGALAVTVIRSMTKHSASSEVASAELVGVTGTLVLPVAPGQPGKVRVEIKGRAEDFVAHGVEDGGNLPTGSTVLIVAEGERGSLLVAKHEM
jgi:membrane protein implicated in regulation of membrane protease activity